MGGVPMLVMIAAMGITYGWQPDDRGGVEYIIQVPPSELREIQRTGEISSVIDPAVRGRVSRVVLRVGDDPLPQIMPPSVAGVVKPAAATIASSDHTPIPVPQMAQGESSQTDATLLAQTEQAQQQAAVMKPDPDEAGAGLGFQFPQSLSSGGAANDPAAAASDPAGNARIAPPGTRLPPSTPGASTPFNPPQFTGSDPLGDAAKRRAAAPSTDPAGRDSSWNGFAGTRPGGPSTDPVNTNALSPAANTSTLGAPTPNPAPANSAAANAYSGGNDLRRGANGIGPNDNFGKLPGGLSLPAENDRFGSAAGDSTYSATQLYTQSPQYAAPTFTGQQPTLPSSAASPGPARPTAAPSQTTQSPDSRLTAAEIAAGGWSIDPYGRVLNAQGQVLERVARSQASMAQTPPYQSPASDPAYDPRSSVGDRYSNNIEPASPSDPRSDWINQRSQAERSAMQRGSASPSTSNSPYDDPSSRDAYRDRMVANQNRAAVPPAQQMADPPALAADRRGGSSPTIAVDAEPQVAAQPLFNGLLLLSLVANVYLAFWLKNLRLRFHELVAAKRMAGNSGSAS